MIDLDDTDTKSKLGGNTMIAVSMAMLRTAAAAHRLPLWRYLAGDAGYAFNARNPDIRWRRSCRRSCGYSGLHGDTHRRGKFRRSNGDGRRSLCLGRPADVGRSGKLAGVADEEWLVSEFDTNEDALDMLVRAIEAAEMMLGEDIRISLNAAASEFGKLGRYTSVSKSVSWTEAALVDLLSSWVRPLPHGFLSKTRWAKRPDPFPDIHTGIQRRHPDHRQRSGDQHEHVRGATLAYANSALIKPNQKQAR